jgi:hypothetical protein
MVRSDLADVVPLRQAQPQPRINPFEIGEEERTFGVGDGHAAKDTSTF